MAKVSQRTKKVQNKIESRSYKAIEALQLLKEAATAKFTETAEAHISLRLDTKYAFPKATVQQSGLIVSESAGSKETTGAS